MICTICVNSYDISKINSGPAWSSRDEWWGPGFQSCKQQGEAVRTCSYEWRWSAAIQVLIWDYAAQKVQKLRGQWLEMGKCTKTKEFFWMFCYIFPMPKGDWFTRNQTQQLVVCHGNRCADGWPFHAKGPAGSRGIWQLRAYGHPVREIWRDRRLDGLMDERILSWLVWQMPVPCHIYSLLYSFMSQHGLFLFPQGTYVVSFALLRRVFSPWWQVRVTGCTSHEQAWAIQKSLIDSFLVRVRAPKGRLCHALPFCP